MREKRELQTLYDVTEFFKTEVESIDWIPDWIPKKVFIKNNVQLIVIKSKYFTKIILEQIKSQEQF